MKTFKDLLKVGDDNLIIKIKDCNTAGNEENPAEIIEITDDFIFYTCGGLKEILFSNRIEDILEIGWVYKKSSWFKDSKSKLVEELKQRLS